MLFKLIDQNSNGELILEELIMGAAIPKGEARSIDLQATKQDIERIEHVLSCCGSRARMPTTTAWPILPR